MNVAVLPLQPHCFAFGGFELQMLGALEAVRAAGVNAQPLNSWDRNADFDVLHVWGFDLAHLHTLHWARRSRKRIVLTALLPYLDLRCRLRHAASWICGPARMRQRLLNMIDILVVVNQAQADTARRLLAVPAERVAVIPNIVAPQYFASAVTSFGADASGEYVLCAGNICARKNQLNLARAALSVGCQLVLIGNPLAGEERYGEMLGRLIEREPTIDWLPAMPAGSAKLVAAYHAARVFALPSFEETQPISLLEAAAACKALVVSDLPFARQRHYRNAYRVRPESVKSIAKGLCSAIADPGRYTVPLADVAPCTSEQVGLAYRRVFERLTCEAFHHDTP